MESPVDIQKRFAGFPFARPATPQAIEGAEARLGHELPAMLKVHYLAYDGFSGPTGERFFHSLEQLVDVTLWLRGTRGFPEFMQQAVAVAEFSDGAFWLILTDQPGRVVEWSARMEDEERVALGGSLTGAWLVRKRWYDEITE